MSQGPFAAGFVSKIVLDNAEVVIKRAFLKKTSIWGSECDVFSFFSL